MPAFAEKRATQAVYRGEAIRHISIHEQAPVAVISVGILEKGVDDEHIPEALPDTDNIPQDGNRLDCCEHIAQIDALAIRGRRREPLIVIRQ